MQRYQNRISGPLMDVPSQMGIDIHVDVRRVPFQKLSSLDGGEPSATIRARVEAARTVQAERFKEWGKAHVLVNGDMGPASPLSSSSESKGMQRFCQLDEAGYLQ